MVEKIVEAMYFENTLGEWRTLPEVLEERARTCAFSWKADAPTMIPAWPKSKVSSIAHMNSPDFKSTNFDLTPKDMGR